MMPQPTRLSGTLAAALVVVGIGCSPTAPAPPPTAPAAPPSAPLPPARLSNNLVIQGISPVAGKPAEHTAVRILGTGFQSGAIVTFDGNATPAIVDGVTILTTAPPHRAGTVDIVVTNPDGRTSRLELAFTYVEHFNASGDITIGPGDSVTAMLGSRPGGCTDEGSPCRRLFIRAPADDTVDVELVPLDRRQNVGLYDEREVFTHHAPTHYPKQLTVRGGQQVWVMGEWSLFRLTARLVR